ncbi:hypothetical protein [Mycoplasma phocimorsus]|uniref:hypothetical protein n=1 Tax=Mycoplasma phocimorsus TaxID=3045839 RepID=UPI0024BF51EA|nr:hypothetical protein [Mycoplasma phocimorsus]MDJ1647350.1 hypothetical protein [Mycoplasma phocimorsus]
MKFSINKLKELLKNESLTNEEIVNAINDIGFEVEELIQPLKHKNIKFCKVLSVSKNPNGERLNVCEVKFNNGQRVIQTTDNSVKEGKTYIAIQSEGFAGDIIIKNTSLKGVQSQGMFCSLEELGWDPNYLNEEVKGKIFNYEAKLESKVSDELDLNDYYVDVSILSNRNDANSYKIMSLELAAYFDLKVNNFDPSKIYYTTHHKTFGYSLIDEMNIIEDMVSFKLKEVPELTIKEKALLVKSEVKLADKFTNYANYLSLMYGLPIYVVNDDKTFKIELQNELVVLNSENNNIILGIENTTKIKDPVFTIIIPNIKVVRKNLKFYKKSNRNTILSMKKVSAGLINLFSFDFKKVLKNVVIFKHDAEREYVEYSKELLDRYANFEMSKSTDFKKIQAKLNQLGFDFTAQKTKLPVYRYDIKTTEDFIEEVFRFYGYSHFQTNNNLKVVSNVAPWNNNDIKLSSMGYQGILTYTLVNKEEMMFNPFSFENEIKLKTYVSENNSIIRNSLLPSFLRIINYNYKRKITRLNLFEEGMINNGIRSIMFSSNTKSFNEIKANLSNIIGSFELRKFEKNYLHKNISAQIIKNGNIIGWIGKLNPKFDLSNSIFVEIIQQKYNETYSYYEYKNTPLVSLDITFKVEENQSISEHLKMHNIDASKVEIIDKYNKDNYTNTTIRITSTKEEIELLSKAINR